MAKNYQRWVELNSRLDSGYATWASLDTRLPLQFGTEEKTK